MFNSDIESLCDDSGSDSLVYDDSNGMLSDIEDSSCPSMIEFVRHTLLKGTVSFDVDEVTPFVGSQIRCQMFDSVLLEISRKFGPRSSPVSLGVRHLDLLGWLNGQQDFGQRSRS